MDKKLVLKWGIGAGLLQIVYIALVSFFIMATDGFASNVPSSLGFSLFLTLFVLSAAISASIVFGYPAYLVYKNKIKEAVATALVTMATLLVIFLAGFLIMSLIK